ncbi:MAG: phage holin family protein [Anaerolineae bacterium]|jgi:hypothetical protein
MINRTPDGRESVRPKDERSIGELFTELLDETRTLLRHELRLARAETTQSLSNMARGAAQMGVGGVVAHAGFLALVAAAILLAAEVLPAWLSALLVGLVLIVVGYLILRGGQAQLQRESVVPDKTIETLKEDREWLRDQTS